MSTNTPILIPPQGSQALGRVQLVFKGTYNSTAIYDYLDNVYYNGATYVSLKSNNRGYNPTTETSCWQKIAEKGAKGDTGTIGTPTASITMLASDSSPTISVTSSGPSDGRIFDFSFGIPAGSRGPVGFTTTSASAVSLPSDAAPFATATLEDSLLSFNFGIPAAIGEGAQTVDGISMDSVRNISLGAVRYTSQSLDTSAKLQACNNIDAISNPSNKINGNFLYFNGEKWVANDVHEFPAGGLQGQILRKTQNTDYQVAWESCITITDSRINSLFI